MNFLYSLVDGAMRRGKRKNPPSPYNSDDEDALLFANSESARLNWRSDPEESHSDWTIIITVDGEIHSTYKVHKSVLSFGAKRGKYFESLFRSKGLKEHETRTSQIEFTDIAAKTFPNMLDFIYSCDDETTITAHTSVPLYHFGTFFDIPLLRSAVRAFWNDKLDFSGFIVCYEHSKIFQGEKAGKAIVTKILKTLPDHISDPNFLKSSDEEFWMHLLRKNNGKPHENLSVWVSEFCSHRQCTNQLTRATFSELIDISLLPELHPNAAVTLMVIEKRFMSTSDTGRVNELLSPLQNRCIERVALDYWEAWNRPGRDLSQLSPSLLSRILARSLEIAKRAKDKVDRENNALKGTRIRTIVISGATDVPGVNGEYRPTGRYTDADDGLEWDKYVKFGPFDGHSDNEFQLSGYVSGETDVWTIVAVDQPDERNEIKVYSVTIPDQDDPLYKSPPENGWMRVHENGSTLEPEFECICRYF